MLVDTGFWLALANRRDRYHGACVAALEKWDERLITTWPVVVETCHLLLSRIGVQAQIRFIESARDGAFEIWALSEGHWPRALELLQKYRDLPMDLADASLVLAAEELGSGRILSTDQRDFRAYRWKNRKPFKNLLESV